MTDNGAEDGPVEDRSAAPNEGTETPPEDRGVIIFDPGDDAGTEVGGFRFATFEDDASDDEGPIRDVSTAEADSDSDSGPGSVTESDSTPATRAPDRGATGGDEDTTGRSAPADATPWGGEPSLDSIFGGDEDSGLDDGFEDGSEGGFGEGSDEAGSDDVGDDEADGGVFADDGFGDEGDLDDGGHDDGSMVILGDDGQAETIGTGVIDSKGPSAQSTSPSPSDPSPEAGLDEDLVASGESDGTAGDASTDAGPADVSGGPTTAASGAGAGSATDDLLDDDALGRGTSGTASVDSGPSGGAVGEASATTPSGPATGGGADTESESAGEATARIVSDRSADRSDAAGTDGDDATAESSGESGDLSPTASAVASFFIPGLGQYLNGQSTRAAVSFGVAIVSDALLLVIGVGLAAVLGVFLFVALLWLLLPVVHIVIAWDAFRQARGINRGEIEV